MDLSKPELNPVEIYRWLTTIYKDNWLLWESKVLSNNFKNKKIAISDTNFQLILALRLLVVTQRPWLEPGIFEKVVLALNGIKIHPGIMEDVTPQQMAFAIECMEDISPSNEFSEDVKKYIAAKCFVYGLVYLEPPLAFVNIYINELIKNRSDLQLLQDQIKKGRNKVDIKNNNLKFQISELNAIGEYIRRRYAPHKYK